MEHSGDLAKELETVLGEPADLCRRQVRVGGLDCVLLFLDGLTSGEAVAETVLKPLSLLTEPTEPAALRDRILEGAVYCAVAQACRDPETALDRLLGGFCLLCVPGTEALAFEVKSGEKRGVSEPEVESTTRGPKDAFTETARTNTALIRRHLRNPKLRVFETTAGTGSRTGLSLLWVEGRADPALVTRMRARLEALRADDLLTPAAVETAVTGRRGLPFPLLQDTERTDKLAEGLLAGRLALFADGLPVGWLAPVNLGLLLRSAEDRDTDPVSTLYLRLLRLAALVLSLLLPALYVAMASFHQEMLPTLLLQAIIESKEKVPFPTALEILGLLAAFELLQEAGLSAPKAVSQPVSIIGGLVVGTAAVEANLISPAALILVSAAGICGFALPTKRFTDAVRLCRFALTVCAALAGLYGLTLGLLVLLTDLAGLDSFGRAWLAPVSDLRAPIQYDERPPS